jgi:NitT/TauT family transport system substrate-binding protein
VRKLVHALVAVAAAAALAVGAATAGPQAPKAPSKVTIAYQPGVGYAPLIVLKQQKTLEKQFPNTQFDWKVLASGAAITNGVVSGDIQIGAQGIAPILVGWAQGVNWKIVAPLDWGDLWLMAKDPSIKTIADLKGKKIAMPSPTSIQAAVLRKMAQAKLGDAHALDSTIVSMDHPDAMQALLSGQIDAHLTSAPFQLQEKVRGAHVVARSYQYFGAHSFLAAAMTQTFYADNTDFANAFYKDVAAAIKLVNDNPTKVAKILQDDSGGVPTWRQYKQWLGVSGLKFTTQPLGIMRFASFMSTIGMISKVPASWKDLAFPPVAALKGS